MKQLELDIQKYLAKNCAYPKDTFDKDAKALLRLIKSYGFKVIKIKVRERRR